MATHRCVNRPPQSSQPGPTRGTSNPQPNTATGVPNPRQQGPQHTCPGTTSQDHQPGPPCISHPHTHIPPHPFMYIPPGTHPQPPPMPPFLQYHWSMPYSYNPFAGFPPMGYGMVMPPLPFPPNPYLEAPGYMLPQPHLQQVNYRRLRHAQFPAAPYQNQNRRFQPQHNGSTVRETVSSEVQTEPAWTENYYADRSPFAGSESGHGTNSSTPSPSASSDRKQSHAAVENYTTAGNDTEGNLLVGKIGSSEGTVKRGSETLSTKPKAMKSQTRTPLAAQNSKKGHIGHESVSCRHGSDTNADVWSMCSSDSIVPVCSSSDREDEVATKERRVSFPDILMSWVGGTPPVVTPEFSDKPLPKEKEQLTAEDVTKKICCKNLPMKSKQLEDDYVDTVFSPKESEALSKILRLPFYIREKRSMSSTLNDPAVLVDSIVAHIHSRNGMSQHTPIDSPNQLQKVPDNELVQDDDESALHDEATDIMQETFSSNFQFKRKMNESIWSVESLAAYVPSQDWLMQNGLLDPGVITEEILEDVQKSGASTQSCIPTVHSSDRRRRFSFSAEALPMYITPPSWLADQHNLNHSNTFPLTTQRDVDTSTPTETSNPQICQMGVQTPLSKGEQLQSDQGKDPSNALASSILLEVNIGETTLDVGEGVDMHGSSEPEAVLSPNQESCKVTKRKVISPCSSEQVEAPLSNSLTEKRSPSSSPESLQIREGEQELNGKVATNSAASEQLAVEIQKHDVVSPSKVDCGIQCTIQATSKTSDSCRGYKAKAGEDCEHLISMKKKRRHWKHRQETQTGYGRPDKSKGGD